ncbi:MAG TPA: hypothetical protein VHI93_05140 [Candidatus Thermoplasmatota archaeon]|nr:hypothetical protein [Candidatus Thermoplasmatota archaeon]
MRSWPSWVAIGLGAPLLAAGLFLANEAGVPPLLLPGAILLAAGLHSLQAGYDTWCGCDGCQDGCSGCGEACACGEECACGDGCACCGDGKAPGTVPGTAEHSH